jgi:hypothetical protein
LSFFDEDDEPQRTTQRTRAQPKPRPRSARPAGGRSSDAQNVLVRRLVAVVVAALVLILLFVFVSSCNDRRHKSALADYNLQVSNIGTTSAQTGKSFFDALAAGGDQSPQELYTQVNSLKSDAQKQLEQAQGLSVPGDMADAQQSLLIALMLRRDALSKIALEIRPALADESDAATRAIEQIAAQNQAFNASDTLYSARVVPFIKNGLTKADAEGKPADSQFMREISWVSPAYVAQKLGQPLSSDSGEGNNNSNEPTGPGLHGTGLDATSYGQTTLNPTVSNRLVYATGTGFSVKFTNQGDNDEFNIKVTLKITRASGGSPMTLTKTVPRLATKESATVELPLNKRPPLDTPVQIQVTVNKVPGEQKTDNNKSTYPSLFVQG